MKFEESDTKILSGTSHPELTKEICNILGIEPMKASIGRFEDGEVKVKIEENTRGKNVFLINSLCSPVNDNIMETLITIDALKRASAKSITLVAPYLAYNRQDCKANPRVPISAKLLARILEKSGMQKLMTIDLHSAPTVGFFECNVDHLTAFYLFSDYIKSLNLENLTFLSPDIGRMKYTEKMANRFGNAEIAFIDKRRLGDSEVSLSAISGTIKGRNIFILDDMFVSCATLKQACMAAIKAGAKDIYVAATHGNFLPKSHNNLESISSYVKELIICNTIPIKKPLPIKTTILSVAPLLSEAIKRIVENRSVSELFK